MADETISNEDSGAMVLLAVRDDQGPFETLGSGFSCNKVTWIGKAVASPVAVYLLKKTKNNHSYGGGLVGAMLAAALAKDDGLSTCAAADLPAPIRAQLDPKGKLARKDVVIVPKATISRVKGGGLSGTIILTAGYDTFKISTGLFSMFAKPKALSRMGWSLNTQLAPTAAPVHDTRSDAERVPQGKPLWMKVLLIIGAIAILIAVIALKIAAS